MTVEERLTELSEECREDLREFQRIYDELAAELIEKIKERDATAKLLKVAHPQKIADVRTLLSMQSQAIEHLEILLASRAVLPEKRQEVHETVKDIIKLTGNVEIRLVKRFTGGRSPQLELINLPQNGDRTK